MPIPVERDGGGGGTGGSGTGGGGGGGVVALPGSSTSLFPSSGQTDKLALLEAAIGKPVPLAYGLHLVGGNVILNEEVANGERVLFIALGEGEWDGIEALFVNGKLYDHTDTTRVHFHPGLDGQTGTETDPTTRNQKICSLWPSSFADKFTFSRTAYLALKLAPDPAAPEAMPRVIGIYRTRKVRIFNSSGTETAFQYSTNPADIYADLLISAFVKPRGLIDEALTTAEKAFFDFAQLDTFRTDCNVSTPQGTTRFETHPAFYSSTDLLRALELLFLLGRGYHLEKAGKFAPFMNKARSSLLILGPNDFAPGSFSLGERDTRDAANKYLGKFRNLDAGKGAGTIATTGAAVTGTSTKFLKWFRAGSPLRLVDGAQVGQVREVASVASDTSMTLKSAFSADQSGRLYSNPELQFSKGEKYVEDETHQTEVGRVLTLELDLHNQIPERAERILKYIKAKALDVTRQTGLRALWVPGVLDLLPGDVFTSPGKWDFYDAANNQDWDLLKLVINQNMTFELGGEEYDAALYSDAAGAQQDIVPSLPGTGLVPVTGVNSSGQQFVNPTPYHDSAVRELENVTQVGTTAAAAWTTVASFALELSPLANKYTGKLTVTRSAVTQNGSDGPRSPATAAAAGGSVSITNPNNAKVSDNVYATATLTPGDDTIIDLTNFSFALPANAVPVGMLIESEGVSGGGSGLTYHVIPLKAGTPTGTEKTAVVPTAEAYTSFGANNDLFSGTFAKADIEATGFGARVRVTNDIGFNRTLSLDHVRITVYYATYTMDGRIKIGSLTSNVVSISNPATASAATDVTITGLTPGTSVTVEVQGQLSAGSGTVQVSFAQKRYKDQHKDHFV